MNLKEIKEMISLMNENDLDELEIEKEGMRIRLKKKPEGVETALLQGHKQILSSPSAEAMGQSTPVAGKNENLIEVKAPMVGTFYRAPTPEAPPYIEVNQKVNKGDIVCIIEAMKLMNEIKSEAEGKIVEILVENGRPVEFGQTLFLVDPKA